MRVGIYLQDPRAVASEARRAETHGYDFVGCGEHFFFHSPSTNGFVMLAAAAGVTNKVRLVTSVTLLPLYPPPMAAKLAATLDHVSNGRLEIGVGAGGEYPREFDAMGVSLASRFRRVDEALEIMRLLFTGESVSFDGTFTTLEDVRLDPPPIQQPSPPLWVAGRKGSALNRVARYADVWFPYMVTPQHVRAGLDQIRTTAASIGRANIEELTSAVLLPTCIDRDGRWARSTGLSFLSKIYGQSFERVADKYLLLGTPDQALERVAEFADAGVERLALLVAAPPHCQERVNETVDQIVPLLQAL